MHAHIAQHSLDRMIAQISVAAVQLQAAIHCLETCIGCKSFCHRCKPRRAGLAAMAKRLATDAGFEVVNGCLQLHGGYGYLRDHPIERVLRDVRVHQILEGTNEIMRLIVSRDLLEN